MVLQRSSTSKHKQHLNTTKHEVSLPPTSSQSGHYSRTIAATLAWHPGTPARVQGLHIMSTIISQLGVYPSSLAFGPFASPENGNNRSIGLLGLLSTVAQGLQTLVFRHFADPRYGPISFRGSPVWTYFISRTPGMDLFHGHHHQRKRQPTPTTPSIYSMRTTALFGRLPHA